MLRSIALGLALSIMAGACALLEPPPPAGTRPIAARVHNGTSQPAEILVTVPTGVLRDAVQPSVVPPGTRVDVTINVPTSGDWTLVVNNHDIDSTRPGIAQLIREGCTFKIELLPDGISVGCAP